MERRWLERSEEELRRVEQRRGWRMEEKVDGKEKGREIKVTGVNTWMENVKKMDGEKKRGEIMASGVKTWRMKGKEDSEGEKRMIGIDSSSDGVKFLGYIIEGKRFIKGKIRRTNASGFKASKS